MRWVAAGLGLLVVGCATQAEQRMTAVREATQLGNKRGTACMAQVNANPSHAAVRARLPVSNGDVSTLRASLDRSVATSAEVPAIIAYLAAVQHCRDVRYAAWEVTDPMSVAIFREGDVRVADAARRLVNGEATWGETVVILNRVATEVITRVRNNEANMRSDAQASHAREMDRRAVAADAFSRSMQQQQIINNMNRPMQTNCTRFGNNTNCTTF